MTRIFKGRKALGTGHAKISRLEQKLPEKRIKFCIHNDYCHIRIRKKYDCLKSKSNACGQIKKFYDKYGEAGNQIGI